MKFSELVPPEKSRFFNWSKPFVQLETTRGSFINPDTHLRAVELLSAGRINVEPLITHTFGIGEMEQAIKMQMGGESIKVMVLPNKR